MVSLQDQILSASDLNAYTENRHGLPSRDVFVAFIVDRLSKDSSGKLSTPAVLVSRDSEHAFKVTGSVAVAEQEKQLDGRIIWLPKLDCFRGHITIDPEGRVNQILIDEANAVRSIPWRNTKWFGDDHDHCRLCMATLSEHPSDAAFVAGYTAENAGWLCPDCYNNVVIGGGDHPWLKPTDAQHNNLLHRSRGSRGFLKSMLFAATRRT